MTYEIKLRQLSACRDIYIALDDMPVVLDDSKRFYNIPMTMYGGCYVATLDESNTSFIVKRGVVEEVIVPLAFCSSFKPLHEYSVTPAQQELVDELEGTIRSLEVKLRCLKAFVEGKSQPDIAAIICNILDEEGMVVFE